MISPSHLKAHGITGAEYKLKYPGSVLRIQSAESKAKASLSKKGKPAWNQGIPTGPNIKLSKAIAGKSRPHAQGLKRTAEQKQNISVKTKEAMKTAMTDEVRIKLSQSIKQRKLDGTYTAPMTGKKVTEETKNKIRASIKISTDIKSAEILKVFEESAALENVSFLDVENNYWIRMHCNTCDSKFTFSRQIFRQSTKGGCQICPTCYPRLTGRSLLEEEVYNFIKSVDESAIANDRDQLAGKEIDIYLPDLKIGFEFTGLYWHSEKQNSEKNHLLWKQQYAAKVGIKLITIYEDEWVNKQNIVKSRILGLLGKHQSTLNGRSTQIRTVEAAESKKFLELNHIQGKDSASVRIGLYDKDELVMIATFKKSNMVKGGDGRSWELSRLCSTLGTRVRGGASKLIKYFQITFNTSAMPLISYADSRWSSGDLYKAIGFNFCGTTPPSYWYMLNYKSRIHRSSLMKHKLVKSEEDKQLTEWQLAKAVGYDRIWDCGTTKWMLNDK
jgi:hypothetical protein